MPLNCVPPSHNYATAMSKSIFLALLAFLTIIPAADARTASPSVEREMAAAAAEWLEQLSPELRSAARFEFDGPERRDWHFVPKERTGVGLHEMNLEQRRAAHELIRTALSNRGYLKAIAIMSLEQVLREVESDRPDVESIRHPAKYWFAVYGEPGRKDPWGWRIEGHHLSLNLTIVPGHGISVAPAFLGANPAEIRTGNMAGVRVLGQEEDLARDLLGALSPQQRSKALISETAPDDVLTAPGASLDIGERVGVAYGAMKKPQQQTLRQLVRELAGCFRQQLARIELQTIEDAGWDKVHFAWAGSTEPGDGHYFRIHGPEFVIEYDNTQNDANHIHIVWHSLDNDFAADALKRHYETSPHHAGSGAGE